MKAAIELDEIKRSYHSLGGIDGPSFIRGILRVGSLFMRISLRLSEQSADDLETRVDVLREAAAKLPGGGMQVTAINFGCHDYDERHKGETNEPT